MAVIVFGVDGCFLKLKFLQGLMALDWIPYNFNDVINLKGSAYFPKVLIGIRDLRLTEVVENGVGYFSIVDINLRFLQGHQ